MDLIKELEKERAKHVKLGPYYKGVLHGIGLAINIIQRGNRKSFNVSFENEADGVVYQLNNIHSASEDDVRERVKNFAKIAKVNPVKIQITST